SSYCKACGSSEVSSIDSEWYCWSCGKHSARWPKPPQHCKECGSTDLHFIPGRRFDLKAYRAGRQAPLNAPFAYYCEDCGYKSKAWKSALTVAPGLSEAIEKGLRREIGRAHV